MNYLYSAFFFFKGHCHKAALQRSGAKAP
uniref:Uncharacterized protein n=1 Tax=Anguilla anguilla TaxID=7936 RepID=A0A0E9SLL8_ANGAN